MSAHIPRENNLILNLQHLLTFRTVAVTGTFTGAALMLGYSQSSVTHHVQVLERNLETILLKRTRFSRVVLTEAGRHVLEYAERLLTVAEEMKAAIRKERAE
ncbi:MAG TPA: LysR family transcriptional regulator [Bryobacteraceae bacterium]|nr:LysR family transcriptional regulator [Bryobacteraceae bacterium]